MTAVAPDLKIEPMTDLDWLGVAEIYREGIATGASGRAPGGCAIRHGIG